MYPNIIYLPSVVGRDIKPTYPKVLYDLKESIVKGLGFQAEDFKISGFDLRDHLMSFTNAQVNK
ncbi:hypothetical protein H5410_045427 [Solanum commersonii]|uniref:Uncharacterized protein n=1 Tax=Solanum commersonii TaxID=4109 RepID=A0A9J5X9I0_SOLCO|nr:hypothetical protein H5410_045427 [Solanum commersonii]